MADIKQYLDYIGLANHQNKPATFELLCDVVAAHLSKFSYQNTNVYLQGLLDVKERVPTDISIDSIFNQFIVNGNSGYCYQNNELLAWALEELGFKLNRYLVKTVARLREKLNESDIKNMEFCHEALIVELDNDKWLIDTGFADKELQNLYEAANRVCAKKQSEVILSLVRNVVNPVRRNVQSGKLITFRG